MAEIRRIPAPRQGDWEWQLDAACRGQDTSKFYHPENERGPSRARRERQAKAVCATCPVLENCLRWALAAREPYGVWGGTSAEDRDAILAHRPHNQNQDQIQGQLQTRLPQNRMQSRMA